MSKITICPLCSGSSGNSILIQSGSTNILVDCGVTGKCVEGLLQSVNVSAQSIDAIIVTHEHIDHISGVGVMSRRYSLPVFSTLGTWKAMINSLGKINPELIHYIAPDVPFKINDITITPFATSHDAAQSIGNVFSAGNKSVAVATDLGTVDRHIYELLLDCSAIVIEANHDEAMLRNGFYPQNLKERILSDYGHLSNRLCGALCAKLVREGNLRQIMLGHLSKDNNTPDLAYKTVASCIEKAGLAIGNDVDLFVAKRDCASEKLVANE